VVARYADEWDMAAGPSPELYRERRTQLADVCRKIGRDPDTIYRSVSTAYLVGRDERELLARVAALQALDPSLAGIDPALVPEVLRALGWRVGTPEQLVVDLQALAAEGVQRVILQHNDLDDLDALELLAGQVLPTLTD
jgi:alkanesulfonate monooxygenase SsuD/methylene tetrahydromethanopterin reductase-like flavin-dependent oxidoreductase (luciferase family)